MKNNIITKQETIDKILIKKTRTNIIPIEVDERPVYANVEIETFWGTSYVKNDKEADNIIAGLTKMKKHRTMHIVNIG